MKVSIENLASKAKASTSALRTATEEQRRLAILAIKKGLEDNKEKILAENAKDVEAGSRNKLSSALLDRLALNEARLKSLGQALQQIAESPQVVDVVDSESVRPDGLKIARKRIALGVVAVIFESRPNVLIDCAALAIKSGNAILLKGGSDAALSNAALGQVVQNAIATHLPADCVQIVPAGDRQQTIEMVKLVGLIDLVIPRGGEGLIRMIQEHARIPVIAHAKGLCHLYLHRDAEEEKAVAITMNAKAQRPGVCNAIETLLVHKDLQSSILPKVLQKLSEASVRLRVDPLILKSFPAMNLEAADDSDWDTEYLDKILSVRIVANEDEAIAHIQKHSSQHTEAIVARDRAVISKFEQALDSSCIAINASTRFNDGGELGLGAEIGISTSKMHAYGPMGAREMTTIRFVVSGEGHVRS